METTINVSELKSMDVKPYWFFNYLAINLNIVKDDEFNIGEFYDLLIGVKNDRFINILAEFIFINKNSALINLCNHYYNNVKYLTIIYDDEKILINLNYRGHLINLIIKQDGGFNINDYLEYEAEMLNIE